MTSFAGFHYIAIEDYIATLNWHKNEFAYITNDFSYISTPLHIAHLDDADQVAEAAIQRRASLGRPGYKIHGGRNPARVWRRKGGVGRPDGGEEEGEEQSRRPWPSRRHMVTRGQGTLCHSTRSGCLKRSSSRGAYTGLRSPPGGRPRRRRVG
jgi:hypothetical protein